MNLELLALQVAENEAKSEARRAAEDARRAEYEAKADARQSRTEGSLRRWAALGVQEARRQRARQREIDLSITRLAAAQLVTEEKLAAFIASLGTGRNGGSKA